MAQKKERNFIAKLMHKKILAVVLILNAVPNLKYD